LRQVSSFELLSKLAQELSGEAPSSFKVHKLSFCTDFQHVLIDLILRTPFWMNEQNYPTKSKSLYGGVFHHYIGLLGPKPLHILVNQLA